MYKNLADLTSENQGFASKKSRKNYDATGDYMYLIMQD
jgi:hypothetical protein